MFRIPDADTNPMEYAVVDGGPPNRPRKLGAWLLLGGLLLVGGSAGSYLGAASMSHHAASSAAREFRNSSDQVTEQIQQEIIHEEDLVINAGVFAANHRVVSDRVFNQWASQTQVLSRYPEMISMAYIAAVPNDQLKSFEAQVMADPPGDGPIAQPFAIQPPGVRSLYCLLSASLGRSSGAGAGGPNFPSGYDYCQGAISDLTLATRDMGTTVYFPFSSGNQAYLVIGMAVYQGGYLPSTVSARRAAFKGVLGFLILPDVVLEYGLAGHPGIGLTFSYRGGSTPISFSEGRHVASEASHRTVLTNGWTVQTFAALPSGGVTSDAAAEVLWIGGTGLSIAIVALILVLATGRYRAWRLVSQKTAEIRHRALHDILTGLPNRALVMDRAAQMLDRSGRDGTDVSALFVDVDGFKTVNDTMGHEIGDELLKAVAERLRICVRSFDTVARLGGDEFVVLIDGAGGTGPDGPGVVAERMVEAMQAPFELDGIDHPVMISISIGVATGPRESAKDLIRDADLALYQAKANGKNGVSFYSPDMNLAQQRRFQLELDARAALEQGQFRLVYQPIYDINDLSIVRIEALLRWQHPEFGLIRPDEFIPLLEASGDIVESGRWVLEEACRQVAQWRRINPGVAISVNVSAVQLARDSIVDHVAEALEASGLEASGLTLEITESGIMQHIESTTDRMHTLKDLGVQLAIDDFGTGYSSLAYIQTLPVDCLKIDRSFTRSVQSSRQTDLVIHSMVHLGKQLGLRIVAEGVENMTQVDHMRREQVDEVQGFLFAKPSDASTIEAEFLAPNRLALPGAGAHPRGDRLGGDIAIP